MARIKIKDGGDRDMVLDYLFPITGRQAVTGATKAIVCATIVATDVVVVSLENPATSTYVLYTAITAGTGFVTTLQASPGSAYLHYAVFHPNA